MYKRQLFNDPRLKLTGGLRYTRENKNYDANYRNNGFAGNVPAYGQSGDLGYNLVTGRVSLSYDLTPANVVYASVARGAKGGGFPNFTTNAVAGKPDQPYVDSSASVSYTHLRPAPARNSCDAALPTVPPRRSCAR